MPGKLTKAGYNTSTVVPMGGRLDDSRPKVIDHPNKLRQFRKTTATQATRINTSHVFDVPAASESKQRATLSKSAKAMHSDPFDLERVKVFESAPKRLIYLPERGPRQEGIRHVYQEEQTEDPKKFVTTNGKVFSAGKFVNPQRFDTTHDKDQPPKDYSKLVRMNVPFRESAAPTGPKHRLGRKKFDKIKKQTLEGVLSLKPFVKKGSYKYRPPWGTGTTPRTGPSEKKVEITTPWASGTTFA